MIRLFNFRLWCHRETYKSCERPSIHQAISVVKLKPTRGPDGLELRICNEPISRSLNVLPPTRPTCPAFAFCEATELWQLFARTPVLSGLIAFTSSGFIAAVNFEGDASERLGNVSSWNFIVVVRKFFNF